MKKKKTPLSEFEVSLCDIHYCLVKKISFYIIESALLEH